MTTSHTPGPWKVFDAMVDGETYGIDGADGTAVVYYGFRDTEDGIRKKADAFLIAAAPELLQALEAIVNDPYVAALGSLGMRAKRVIAKALGEQ